MNNADNRFRERGIYNLAALNDRLRQTGQGGEVVVTSGVAALPEGIQERVFQAVREFSDFTEGNDPYLEHDFGVIEVSGEKYYFKINYYDKSKEYLSKDPSDPNITHRVMTIMLADEY